MNQNWGVVNPLCSHSTDHKDARRRKSLRLVGFDFLISMIIPISLFVYTVINGKKGKENHLFEGNENDKIRPQKFIDGINVHFNGSSLCRRWKFKCEYFLLSAVLSYLTAVINYQRKVDDLGLAACFSKSARHECSFNLIFETRILPFHTLPLMKTYQCMKKELTLEQRIRPSY